MDSYENYDPIPEQPEHTEAENRIIQDVPVKKRSPFADSPYETAFVPEEKANKQKARKHRGWGKRILAAQLILALVIGSCFGTALLVNRKWEKENQMLEQVMNNRLEALQEQINAANKLPEYVQAGTTGEGMTPGQVYAQNVNAVVAVANQSVTTNIYGQVSETASSGSGFIISADGYVVSNYHVVEGATMLTVITADGKEHEAELIGFDSTNDISLMKIEGTDLPHVTIGSSDNLAVGDMVAAIGNPLGELTSSLTVGYVSAKNRIVNTEGRTINMLQTDAAINSGNSGGPLFNMRGEVVGITTAKYSGTSNSGASIEGIGFAIPMDDVAGMLEDLQIHGYVTGAYLGVMVRDVEASVQAYGLPAGAYVEEVTPGYAAERAGLKAQDIIINLGGYEVTSLNTLTRALRKFESGDTTTITVYRAGSELNLSITLDEKPQETTTQPEQIQPTEPEQSQEDWWSEYWNPFYGFLP